MSHFNTGKNKENRARPLSPSKSQPPLPPLADISNRQQPGLSVSPSSPVPSRSSLLAFDLRSLDRKDVLGWFLTEAEIFSREAGQTKSEEEADIQIAELGCGSGRVSFTLHKRLPYSAIVGLGSDMNSLKAARQKRDQVLGSEGTLVESDAQDPEMAEVEQELLCFYPYDIYNKNSFDKTPTTPRSESEVATSEASVAPIAFLHGLRHTVNAVISSLYVGNVPLSAFFDTTTTLLAVPPSFLFITFFYDKSGQKSRTSGASPDDGTEGVLSKHSPAEIKQEAEKWEFEVMRDWEENVQGELKWFAIAFTYKGDV